MKIVVYTINLNNYDEIWEPLVKNPNFDYICLTDNPKPSSWSMQRIKPQHSRYLKINPPFPEYHISIYVDANILIKNDLTTFVQYIDKSDIVVFNHANTSDSRNCIYDEALQVIKSKKDKKQTVNRQMKRYLKEKFPPQFGLSCGTILLRRHNLVQDFMKQWWKEVSNGSHRDQLSFDYIRWKTEFPVYQINMDVRENTWFQMKPHKIKETRWL